MKFLIDAQLPYRLAKLLREEGYDVIHTDDMQYKERTADREIRELAILKNRIVIRKDLDFLDSYYIKNIPEKLLLITTGNIKNKKLMQLFEHNLEKTITLFANYIFLEFNNDEIIGHE